MGLGRERMEQSKPKIGAGWAQAAIRQGAKEIAQVLPAFPSQGIQPVEEPGLPLTNTPRETYEARHGKGHEKQNQIEPEMG